MPTQVMTPIARDGFSGTDTSGLTQSGSCPVDPIDGKTSSMFVNAGGSTAVTGDQFDYVIHFTTGDITLRATYTSPTNMEWRVISTVTGNVFNTVVTNVTFAGFFPLTGADIFQQLNVTRGAANNQTSFQAVIQMTGRTNTFTGSKSFTTPGELTPTGSDYALTGTTAFVYHNDMLPRDLDGGGIAALQQGTWENTSEPLATTLATAVIPGLAISSHRAVAIQERLIITRYIVTGLPIGSCGQGIEAVAQYHDAPTALFTHPGSTLELHLHFNKSPLRGYVATVTYTYATSGSPLGPRVSLKLTAGSSALLRQTPNASISLDTDHTFQFFHQGSLLIVKQDGVTKISFNLATDGVFIDNTGPLGPVYSGDTPAIGLTGASASLSQVTILGEETLPDQPGVITGTQNSGAGAWPVDRQGRWSQGLPSPVDKQGRVIPVQAAWVCDRATGLWVPVSGADTRDDTGDTGDDEPTLGCVDPTPIVITNPDPVDPITGRFFGISNIALSLLGDLFTGTQIPIAQLTTTNLGIAFAAGATLIGGPGGYDKMKSGGVYSPAAFNNWIDTDVAPNLARYLSATADGSLFGLSLYDDFGSTGIFPPHGISQSDLLAGLNHARAALPGVRLGVRGLPSQFPTNLGWDFYTAQYVSWRGTPSAFRAKEQPIAIARSAYIIISMNYLGGGDGSSGIRTLDGTELSRKRDTYEMSAAEVVTYGAGLYTDGTNLAGAIGYQYSGTFLSRPGMIAAFTINHNRIAAL